MGRSAKKKIDEGRTAKSMCKRVEVVDEQKLQKVEPSNECKQRKEKLNS